jgi:hypothetical protein
MPAFKAVFVLGPEGIPADKFFLSKNDQPDLETDTEKSRRRNASH